MSDPQQGQHGQSATGGQLPQGPPPGWQGPPQGPPPGWQGGPPQGPGPNRGRTITIVVVALLVVVGGIVTAAVLLGGDSDDDGGADTDASSPVAVVESVIEALEDGDCDSAREHAPQLDDATCEQLRPDGFSYGEVTEGDVTDDAATVHVAVESPDLPEPLDIVVNLAKENDEWQVTDWTEPSSFGSDPTCPPGSTGNDCSTPVTPDPTDADSTDPTDPGSDPSSAPGADSSTFQGSSDELDAVLDMAAVFLDAAKSRDCTGFEEATGLGKNECEQILEEELPADAVYGDVETVTGDFDDANVVYQVSVPSRPKAVSFTLTVWGSHERGRPEIMGWVYDEAE